MPEPGGWRWIDVEPSEPSNDIDDVVAALQLDSLAVRGALEDTDVGKVDDFGHHLLVVIHGLTSDADGPMSTAQIDCFVTADALVTVRSADSTALDRLWDELQRSPDLGAGGPDELLARLIDVVTRRLVSIVDLLDDQLDSVVDRALRAHPRTVAEITGLRSELGVIRRIARPQREVLRELRRNESHLISDAGRRRFADAYDVGERLIHGLDATRAGLADALDAYHGAEARQSTEVTRVLTIYAAVLLPLSLVVGFFGMNFADLPLIEESWGWVAVVIGMAVITFVSLGMFVASGWLRPFSPARAGKVLREGVFEASKAPVQVVGALYEVTTTPLRRHSRADTETRSAGESQRRD